MDLKFLSKKTDPLDLEIERLANLLKIGNADTAEYAAINEQYILLVKLRNETKRKPISREALLAAGVNIAGILLVIHREQTHAITSKAFGFIAKNSK